MHANATVTICHSKTRDLPDVLRRADIVIAAMGKAAYVEADWIKPGATVIDVGTNRVADLKEAERLFHKLSRPPRKFRAQGSALIGDVHPGAVNIAGALTPVPGGVGPMTIAMLMSNTVKAARLRAPRPNFPQLNRPLARDNSRSCSDSDLPAASPAAKSAVAAMLREMGFAVLDADSLAHRLIKPGLPAYNDVLQEFGRGWWPRWPRGPSKAQRHCLRRSRQTRPLNAIVHPRVAEVVFRQFEEWQRGGTRDAAFVEAALLIESGIHKKLDGLVVAWCAPEQQLKRLLARGLSETEARRRIAAQLPVEEKLRLATEKIDCSGSIEETRRQVEALATKLRRSQMAR